MYAASISRNRGVIIPHNVGSVLIRPLQRLHEPQDQPFIDIVFAALLRIDRPIVEPLIGDLLFVIDPQAAEAAYQDDRLFPAGCSFNRVIADGSGSHSVLPSLFDRFPAVSPPGRCPHSAKEAASLTPPLAAGAAAPSWGHSGRGTAACRSLPIRSGAPAP